MWALNRERVMSDKPKLSNAEWIAEMREQWIREAVRLMELSQYNVENGYYDDELAAELRKHVAKVKLEER